MWQQAVALLEPECRELGVGAPQCSAAISLKRIADAMERLSTAGGVVKLLEDLEPLIDDLRHGRR